MANKCIDLKQFCGQPYWNSVWGNSSPDIGTNNDKQCPQWSQRCPFARCASDPSPGSGQCIARMTARMCHPAYLSRSRPQGSWTVGISYWRHDCASGWVSSARSYTEFALVFCWRGRWAKAPSADINKLNLTKIFLTILTFWYFYCNADIWVSIHRDYKCKLTIDINICMYLSLSKIIFGVVHCRHENALEWFWLKVKIYVYLTSDYRF